MTEKLPQRKNIRLKDYDYSDAGYYSITICTLNRKNILCNIVGGDRSAAPQIKLSVIGTQIEISILKLAQIFNNIKIEQYVVMPNHIHMVIVITGGRGNPPLQDVNGRMKSYTTKLYNDYYGTRNLILWQRNY